MSRSTSRSPRCTSAATPLDKVALAEELRNRGMLDKIGGLAYLNSLMDTVPTAASTEYYARIVVEKSMLRRLIRAGSEIGRLGYDGEDDPPGALDKAEREFAAAIASSKRVDAASTLALRTLADVEPEVISFLWEGRLVRGKINLLVGDPGGGKSYVSLAIAAAVSRGRRLPDHDGNCISGSVIIWNGEDGIGDTIRPRAERLGANLSVIHAIDGVRRGAACKAAPFGLADVQLLDDEIARRGDVVLVIVDPVAALLAGIDAHRDNEVRSALQPLSDLASRRDVALLGVMHLRKGEAERAIYRVAGSIGFVGLARSVLLVARDTESGRRAIVPIKSNLAAPVAPIEFDIVDAGVFCWRSTAPDLTADRLLSAIEPGDEERSKLDDASAAILSILANGEVSARDLGCRLREHDVSARTAERARSKLRRVGKIERLGGGAGGPVRWSVTEPLSAKYSADRHTSVTGDDGEERDSMAQSESPDAADVEL